MDDLSLLSYVAALAAVHVPWGAALTGLVLPRITWNSDYFMMLVAIAGTTISPYLFFWQASQEAEDVRVKPHRAPLLRARRQAVGALARIRADTMVGMAVSNVIAIAIMITTAATLNANGVTNIETSAQAAEALRPIAGPFAALVFTLGIVGTGCWRCRCSRARPPMRSVRRGAGRSGSAARRAKPWRSTPPSVSRL